MPAVVAKPKNASEVSFEQRKLDLKAQEHAEAEERNQAHKSPFASFYQINKSNSPYLRSCLSENPKALELLIFIFEHMDKYNAVMCSYKVFQEALGVSQKTIQRSVKYLKDNGFVYVYKSGTSNVYVANKELVWNSWGSNAKYCEFPANIVLSASEQEKQAKVQNKRVTSVQIKGEK